MKIAINGRFLTQPMTGVQRVAYEMLCSLSKNNGVRSLDVLVPAKQAIRDEYLLPKNCNLVSCGILKGKLWEQIDLPLNSAKYKWLLNFCNQSPFASSNAVLYVHDAQVYLYPDSYSFAFRWWYRFSLPLMARTARKVVTVSKYSRDTLASFGVAKSKCVEVIPNGFEHFFKEDSEAVGETLPDGVKKPFALAIGSLASHKNLDVLLRAVSEGDWPISLVIVGGVDNSVFSSKGIFYSMDGLKFVGRVSDSELLALYKQSEMLLSPSLFEGFGMPVLEACRLKVPVLCSNIPVYRELFPEGVKFIDPESPDAWTNAVKDAFLDNDMRERNALKAYKATGKYSWKAAAEKLLSVLSVDN